LEEVVWWFAGLLFVGVCSFDEDMVFHLKIAEFSKNPVLKSILTLLVSEIIQQFKDFEQSIGKERVLQRLLQAIEEHRAVITAIRSRNPEDAAESMQHHFQRSNEYRDQVMREKVSR
jgi:GntR family transcriptional repressor for pyruvate dehydrogenase complex